MSLTEKGIAKAVLKESIKASSQCLKDLVVISSLLHPETMKEAVFHVHALQNIFIAEYARFTDLKKELKLN